MSILTFCSFIVYILCKSITYTFKTMSIIFDYNMNNHALKIPSESKYFIVFDLHLRENGASILKK